MVELLCPPGYLPDPGIETASTYPALASRHVLYDWLSNWTTGHIAWENHNWIKHIYPNFIVALFTEVRTQKQPSCPLTGKWIKMLWYIYTLKYYSAIKRNTFEPVLVSWMNLGPIIQKSEVSQKERNKYRMCVMLSCLVMSDSCVPIDCSPPGSSVHGDSPGRNTRVDTYPFFRGTSQPWNQTRVSCIAGKFFTSWTTKIKTHLWKLEKQYGWTYLQGRTGTQT